MAIDTVYLAFKTHLDVGFTDYARNVVKQYFECFIPKALDTARELREKNSSCGFVWTTGSWLIYEYLERASRHKRLEMEKAIERGDIAWHGLPFTMHSELMDRGLFDFGLSLSRELDRRFGRRTIAAKMTDVPGHTRSIVPALAQAGIRFLHIGVNPASTAPKVPPLFVWRHESGDSVIVMYSQGGYGESGVVEKLGAALCFAHTGDNLGPQNADGVEKAYEKIRARFPKARIRASRLDTFARKLIPIRASIPVLSSEIGDTWIHGAATDPKKLSQFRQLCRLRTRWLAERRRETRTRAFGRFSRALLVIPEHTWGMDEKTHLGNCTHYTRAQLARLRKTRHCRRFEASWVEQRGYIDHAVRALGGSSLSREASRALAQLSADQPDLTDWQKVSVQAGHFVSHHFEIAFSADTGAITHLRRLRSHRRWASPNNPLALFRYEIFSADDYRRFVSRYLRHTEQWAIQDFTKPGIENADIRHSCWAPALKCLYKKNDPLGDCFLAELAMPPQASAYGAPRRCTLEVELPEQTPLVRIRLQWFDKPACRLPEASWVSFSPRISRPDRWLIDKMGLAVSPLDVVRNGNRALHAAGDGVQYADDTGVLAIRSLDAALVAPGRPSLLDFSNRRPPTRAGMHFNLHNNVWGTNFPMWYNDDASFRFVLHLA